MKIILFLILSVCAMFAQSSGTGTVATDGPPRDWHTKVYNTVGTDLYICYAKQAQNSVTTNATSVTAASPTVLTVSTGHGFNSKSTPTVTITGMTGSWAPLNGTHVATITGTTTLTVAVDSSGFGAVTGTAAIASSAPRITSTIWAVKKVGINTTGNPEFEAWATEGFRNACNNVGSLSFQ
jgi:hypothetical protein